VPLIKDRLIDFIRIHISQIGGLSPARNVQAMCEYFGVRTAWHRARRRITARARGAARAGARQLTSSGVHERQPAAYRPGFFFPRRC
jgi:L-alanine-DL-glutamate epimerase-like enolase superfamily enzyme